MVSNRLEEYAKVFDKDNSQMCNTVKDIVSNDPDAAFDYIYDHIKYGSWNADDAFLNLIANILGE